MAENGYNRGGAQKSSDWLVIPLHAYLHCFGPEAIDGSKGVLSWEAEYGTQMSLLAKVAERLGVDIWAMAKGAQ